jgi:large subunit ribosomal protein L25
MASTNQFHIEASVRQEIGKGASRRLRHQEKVPGVVYGGGQDSRSLTLEHKAIIKALKNEAFYSHILTLAIDGQIERVILKDLQRHPYKPRILHIDFQRIKADEKLNMHIPLHFIGGEDAPGIKEGGIISHIISDVEVSCLPDNLPEYLEIDVSQMALNQILHLSDIKLPKGVEIPALTHDDNKSVVSLHLPRIQAEEEPEAAESEEIAPSEVPASAQKGEEEDKEEK